MSPMPVPPPLKEDPVRVEICHGPEDLAAHAANLFVSQAGRALGSRGRFVVALSGGETPRRMYAMLPQERFAFQVVWRAVEVFFSDERCVPPEDPRSNYAAARDAMLSRLDLPEGSVHRMRGELADPRESAGAYEKDLREIFGAGPPRFDLVLLGMGEDGHTASLFPGSPALEERERWVVAVEGPDGLRRLTLTLPAINAARVVCVLASGERKAEMARRVLGAVARDEGLPIQRIRPIDGQLIWLLDAEAASLLRTPEDGAGTP